MLSRRQRVREEEGDRGVVVSGLTHDGLARSGTPEHGHAMCSTLAGGPGASASCTSRVPGGGGICPRRASFVPLLLLTVLRARHHFFHSRRTSAVEKGSSEGCSNRLLLVSPPRAQQTLSPPHGGSRVASTSRHGTRWKQTREANPLLWSALTVRALWWLLWLRLRLLCAHVCSRCRLRSRCQVSVDVRLINPVEKRRTRRRGMPITGQFKLLEAVAARRLLPHHGQVSVGCRDACPWCSDPRLSPARGGHTELGVNDVHDLDVQTHVLARQDKSRQGGMLMSLPLMYRHKLSPGQACTRLAPARHLEEVR